MKAKHDSADASTRGSIGRFPPPLRTRWTRFQAWPTWREVLPQSPPRQLTRGQFALIEAVMGNNAAEWRASPNIRSSLVCSYWQYFSLGRRDSAQPARVFRRLCCSVEVTVSSYRVRQLYVVDDKPNLRRSWLR